MLWLFFWSMEFSIFLLHFILKEFGLEITVRIILACNYFVTELLFIAHEFRSPNAVVLSIYGNWIFATVCMVCQFSILKCINITLQSWYWCGTPRNEEVVAVTSVDSRQKNPQNFEKEPSGRAGVQIQGLTKLFGPKTAVSNLYLNLFDNQITALLGKLSSCLRTSKLYYTKKSQITLV